MSSSGKTLQLETPGTRRAKELYDLLQLLSNDDDVEGEDRLPALHAVAETVNSIFCAFLCTKARKCAHFSALNFGLILGLQ